MTRQDINQALLQTSFLYGVNGAYIEALQAKYEKDPYSVEAGWREFFDALGDDPTSVEKTAEGASWRVRNGPPTPKGDLINALDGDWPATERAVADKLRAGRAAAEVEAPPSEDAIHRATRDSVRAIMMIRAYRMRGHLHANLDPLGLEPQKDHEELHPATYGFQESDYDRKIFIDHVLGLEFATVREMLAILRRTYCDTIGFEFLHISDPAEKAWIQERVEGPGKEIHFTKEGKRAILGKLVEAEGFENFFDIKYPGGKRFGLDGGEAMIPALEQIIKRGGQLGLKEIALGMAHRGRLNVLSQVMGKPHRVIFHEFKGGSASPDEVEGSGDVKYHLGGVVGSRVRRQSGASVAHRQPFASRDRRSRRARQGARQAGSTRRLHRTREGAAAAHPRRRGRLRQKLGLIGQGRWGDRPRGFVAPPR